MPRFRRFIKNFFLSWQTWLLFAALAVYFAKQISIWEFKFLCALAAFCCVTVALILANKLPR